MKSLRSELLLYCATACLIFSLLVFIPFLGILLYNATILTVFEINTKNIENNFKWKYNGYHGAGDYKRIQIIKKSLMEIEKLNAMESNGSKVYGMTKFSHMSKDEFSKQMLGADLDYCPRYSRSLSDFVFIEIDYLLTTYGDIPPHFDWRDRGVVSPVLDQKRCNACWAFSVVGVMETMLAIKKKERHSERLSIQELLDCCPYTAKCRGGSIDSAMWYLSVLHKPIVSESQYPLNLQDESCRTNPDESGTRLLSYVIRCNVDEKIIPRIIANHGPVMVVLNAGNWQFYTGGIIHRSCENIDVPMKHVVQVVGYDMTGDIPYYIARNSWGTDFGEDGYVRLAMNEDVCGITRKIAYLDVY